MAINNCGMFLGVGIVVVVADVGVVVSIEIVLNVAGVTLEVRFRELFYLSLFLFIINNFATLIIYFILSVSGTGD